MDFDKKLLLEDDSFNKGRYSVELKNGRVLSIKERMSIKMKLILASVILALSIGLFFLSFNAIKGSRIVEQNINISITNIESHAKLEVLTVSADEVIVDSADENSAKIDAWTEFSGKGVFTLDVANSEYIIDQMNKSVVVRTPDVVLDNFTLNYDEINQIFFHNDWKNDSLKVGAELADSQLQRAYSSIYETISTNPYYFDTARKSAKSLVESLVKGLNRDVEGLKVFVEIGVL